MPQEAGASDARLTVTPSDPAGRGAALVRVYCGEIGAVRGSGGCEAAIRGCAGAALAGCQSTHEARSAANPHS